MEWLIDIIKEWVIAQAYATIAYVDAEITAVKAWIEAKLYLQKAEYPGYGMPVHVTGDLDPDVTCTYFRAGDYNNKPLYSQEDGSYFIWWGIAKWNIGTFGDGNPIQRMFQRVDPVVFGEYTPRLPSTGLATVSPGYKYLLTSFVDRGDPVSWDFDGGDLTMDGNWHVLDLGSIVPPTAKAVIIDVFCRHGSVGKIFAMRRKGNSNTRTVSRLFTNVSNLWIHASFIVSCENDQSVEYNAEAPAWLGIVFTVKGWWL